MSKNITIFNLAKKIEQHLQNNTLKNFKLQNYKIIDYQDKIKFKNNTYTRNIIFSNKLFEIIIISWDKNSITNIHNHPTNGCLLTVLEGILSEKIYFNNNTCKYNILLPDSVSYLDDKIGQHLIYSPSNSISLHIYSPPNFYN